MFYSLFIVAKFNISHVLLVMVFGHAGLYNEFTTFSRFVSSFLWLSDSHNIGSRFIVTKFKKSNILLVMAFAHAELYNEFATFFEFV